jgi:predicted transcriptional regulator
MKRIGIAGIILIVVGAIVLIYGGITYTTHKKSVNIGPVHASTSTPHGSIAAVELMQWEVLIDTREATGKPKNGSARVSDMQG